MVEMAGGTCLPFHIGGNQLMRKARALTAVTVGAMTSLALASGPVIAAQDDGLTPAQRDSLEAGIQVAPKGSAAAKRSTTTAPNPYLANVPDLKDVDYSTWRTRMAIAAKARAKNPQLATSQRQAAGAQAATPALVHDEEEPVGTSGSNDRVANAELITGFGTGPRQSNKLRILGSMPDLIPTASALAPVAEDNGSIPLAGDTGITGNGARTTSGTLGDGPHGPEGTGTNDFEFYELTSNAGNVLTVDTTGSAVDTVVGLYSASGELLASNDDGGPGLTSLLEYETEATATYYVLVAAYSSDGSFPSDPQNSGSGAGGAVTGDFQLAISTGALDHDFYAFRLRKGDVIGSTVTGSSSALTVYRPDGTEMVGADRVDASSTYPPESPLPGGGNTTMAYVAGTTGVHVLELGAGIGNYDVTVNDFRPGSEIDSANRVQTIFLDFDGATVNTAIWGGPGVRTLSPFNAFIARWGLNRSQEAQLINRITAEVTENLKTDMLAVNPQLELRIVNSRNSADIFGRTNVSRVIVGGTIAQSGIPTIGIAQFIDPGNYGHEDSAVVLLDTLSNPSGNPSLNTYLNESSDRLAFVSQAIGNVIAHEVGHMVGNFHTDNANELHSLMDAGGVGFPNLYGVGPDGVGGTADDTDTDFVLDEFIPVEGFTGHEDTAVNTAWAYTGRR